ncbi:MAG: crossover junction endodeoxyribonuclease RuvC [Deltaproteobacteria bacterium]|nr:crossover junction endodeoxyribonuclease RuvC [Deltaproteobacteria bacterium]MBN2686829.1 crossover junction endodeoxyribonuclease RuvC [Deltaproteobacteria bacterium]
MKQGGGNKAIRSAIKERDSEQIILGVDPGSRITGYGIIMKERGGLRHIVHGEIKMGRNRPLSACLQEIFDALYDVIESHTPHALSLENIFYGKNIKSLITLGHVRGVAMLAASKKNIPIFEYTPLEVKKAVVGYGRAEKSQIQLMVRAMLKLREIPPVDASDGLAVAICHANFMKVDIV